MKKITLVVIFILFSSIIQAEDKTTPSALFLNLGGSAKASSLGGAYSGVLGEVDSIFYNPAGISLLKGINFSFMQEERFMDSKYGYFLSCINIKNRGCFALSYSYFIVDRLKRISKSGLWNKDYFRACDSLINLSYGKRIGESLYFGLGLKMIQSQIDSAKAETLAIDFGIIKKIIPEKFNMGLCIRNLGSSLIYYKKKNFLPSSLNLGIFLKFLEKLRILGDLRIFKDKIELSFGSEYRLSAPLSLRVGYLWNKNLDNFSFGIGFNFDIFNIDTAYLLYGGIGDSFRISLNKKF